jgi:hypothetical protein
MGKARRAFSSRLSSPISAARRTHSDATRQGNDFGLCAETINTAAGIRQRSRQSKGIK